MSNVTIRRENGGVAKPTRAAAWDPLRMAEGLLRWDPFHEMAPYWPTTESAASYMPAFEVKETKENYVFKADLPGIKEKDLEITQTGSRLTVSGKREAEQEEKSDTYYACERSYGTFTRSFTLPDGADSEHIHADLKDGVMTIVVPKKPEVLPKKISLGGLFGKKS